VLVPRTARQPVRLAHGGDTDDLDRKIQVAHHPADNGELLKIFFTEDGGIRLQDMKQFRDHRTNATEMPGPRLAFERVREGALLHRDRKIDSIHFLRRWPKQNIYSGVPAKLVVIGFRPRIFFVIASRRKLKLVHKNTDGDVALFAGSFPRDPDQFTVTAMERPHRRHKNSAL